MDDLISRAAAIGCLGNSPEEMCMPWSEVERMLHELPAVDAVPVVRCGECKYFAYLRVYCYLLIGTNGKNFYCAAGKRRDTDGKDD